MKTRSILSNPDPNDGHPWFRVVVQDGSTDVEIVEANGLLPHAEANAAAGKGPVVTPARRVELAQDRRGRRSFKTHPRGQQRPPAIRNLPTEPGREDLADEVHVLAQTEEGEIEFVPFSLQRPVYYAHLGWYDPKTGEWEILNFVERGRA